MESLPSLITPVKTRNAAAATCPSSATPDKKPEPPSRVRNQNFALSVSDVRRAAIQLRKSKPVTDSEELTRVGKVKRSEKSPALLSEKYEMLCSFFNAMVSSIRLLRLKRLPATLIKLSRNIESLTDRRFTLQHLAQLKHIVPELIIVKKIRVQDEETGCMKEDLLISLQTDAVETDKVAKGSGSYSHLKGIFHSRILDFANIHPEAEIDVPEGELPELFYKPKQESEPSINHTSVLPMTTLTAPLFKRRFSSRALLSASIPESPIEKKDSFSMIEIHATPVETASVPSKLLSTPAKFSSTPAKSAATPAKSNVTPAKFASTPANVVLTPVTATPALRPPKRSRSLITDDDASNYPSKPAKSLKFEDFCDDIEEKLSQDSSAASMDLLDVLPENLYNSLKENERKSMEEQNPIVMQANKRHQLIAGVPKLFDMIPLLFQSIRRSVITKEELIHKIITRHLDIVDRGEVEEQLILLQEIAPEYITEQSCVDGNTLLRLNKLYCADSIRAKLLEAK